MLGLTSILVVLAAVGVHYEAIALATQAGSPFHNLQRLRVAIAIIVIVVAHLVEVVVFAGGWAFLIAIGSAELSLVSPDFADLVYFSGSVYTSLGFGDIVPVGYARLFTVVEAVTGLVLIAWTASYTFLQMQKNWRVD